MEDKASRQDEDAREREEATMTGIEPDGIVLSGIKHPGQNDVMFGRGGDTNYHIGNHRFRLLADEYIKKYHEASRKDKAVVVQQLVSSWRSRHPPGRFLTRTDPSRGEESLWHDVGTAAALKKAAKILSERSIEFRTAAASSRKRKAGPTMEAVQPTQPKQDAHAQGQPPQEVPPQGQPTFGVGGTFMEQQPFQQDSGPLVPYLAGAGPYASAYQGLAEHPRKEFTAGTPLGCSGADRKPQAQGGTTQTNLASVRATPVGPAAAPLRENVGAESSSTPGGRGRGEGQAAGASNQEGVDDASPESIAQDPSGVSENLPSAASLAGVFTSSGSEARGKDSSPSTDES